MGAPGAGKGTQARLIEQRLGLPQVSTGDMFRALNRERTALARQVRALMEDGNLVPDDVTIKVVEGRTKKDDCRDGYVLDGFPRTTAQAQMLETLAWRQGHAITVILVDVPLDVLEKRMTGRRTCPVCGEIYNIYFKPPKSAGYCNLHPKVELTHRGDDQPATIKRRLKEYKTKTRPLLDYYKKSNRYLSVDGTREPRAIFEDIKRLVTSKA